MYRFKEFAEATASATKSICLIAAILFWFSVVGNAAAIPSVTVPAMEVGAVSVTVTPLSSWQSQHPDCKVSAIVDQCGNLPTAVITGEDCIPSTGTVNVAQVVVQDDESNCETYYLIRTVDGSVQVVVIDP